MKTLEQFIKEHELICSKTKRATPSRKRECGKNMYQYLLKINPQSIDTYNQATKKERFFLRKNKDNQA